MWNWFFKHKPTGPFKVGARDVTYLRSSELTPYVHLAGRLFYPTAESAPVPICFWISHQLYAYGYANSLLFPEHFNGWKYAIIRGFIRTLIYVLGSTTGLSCSYETALLPPQAVTLDDVNGAMEGADGKLAESCDKPPRQKLPVIIFSHGLTGNRNTYSSLCIELASRGYVVLALEHADGSASAARLAGPVTTDIPGVSNGWRFYAGWASDDITHNRTRWRVKEVMTAQRLLTGLSSGEETPGLRLSGLTAAQQRDFFAGRLDLNRLAVAGHSYGGATAAMAASEHPEIKAAVALDPWWYAMPPESSAVNRRWKTTSPMLVVGSQDWNTPKADGTLLCGEAEMEAVLAGAAAGHPDKAGKVAQGGPGALHLVARGSSHHSFDDVLLLFGGLIAPVLRASMVAVCSHQAMPWKAGSSLGDALQSPMLTRRALSHLPRALQFDFNAHLPQERALEICVLVIDHFLKEHTSCHGGLPVPLRSMHTEAYRKLLGADLFSLTEAYT